MKLSAMVVLVAGIIIASSPAWADFESARMTRLINATQQDYNLIKTNFRAANRIGDPSWDSYRLTSGFEVQTVRTRITGRRNLLARMAKEADQTLPANQRGLAKLVIYDLDGINLSLLALIDNDNGYEGYLRTRDDGLIKGISEWQEGIRLALKEAKRCMSMIKAVTAQFRGMANPVSVTVH